MVLALCVLFVFVCLSVSSVVQTVLFFYSPNMPCSAFSLWILDETCLWGKKLIRN